jgi:PPP family 3-phenylpropionic acid transporter
MAAYVGFKNLYFQEIGFSGSKIGILSAIPAVINVFTLMFWGYLSDMHISRRALLTFAGLVSAFFIALMAFGQSFLYIFMITIAISLFYGPLPSLTDTTVLLKFDKSKSHYGHVRLWGSIGFALLAEITGIILKMSSIKIAFFISVVCLIGFVIPLRLLDSEAKPLENKHTPFTAMKELLSSWPMVHILIIVTLSTSVSIMSISFLPLYMVNIGGNESDVGHAYLIAAMSEVPIYMFGHKLIGRFKLKGLILTGIFFQVIRWFLYGCSHSITAILLIQILHGFTFGAFFLGMVTYVHHLAPPRLETSAQTLLSICWLGTAPIIGNLFGGVIMDLLGLKKLFFIGSFICLCTLILFLAGPKTGALNLRSAHK